MKRDEYQSWVRAARFVLGEDHPVAVAMQKALDVGTYFDLATAAERIDALRRHDKPRYQRLVAVHQAMIEELPT